MGKFNSGFRGKKDFGGRGFDGNRGGFNRGGFNRSGGGGRPSMHSAVCAKCGDECEVPFRPSGDKPVFCSNCFEKPAGGRGGDRFGKSSFSRPSFGGSKKMFSAVCDKCGENCELPFQPRSGKSVLCSDCFGKKPGGRDGGSDVIAKKLDLLESKLDLILKSLALTESKAPETKKIETEKFAKAEKKTEKKAVKSKEAVVKTKTAVKKTAVKKKK